MTPLKTQAIQTALLGDWKTAIAINEELLKDNPDDIETLNRLGFALSVLGKTNEAKKMYQKVLVLDNKNPIALKNLKRLGETGKKAWQTSSSISTNLSDTTFLEESGKTKVVEIINVAQPNILNLLMIGESLVFRLKRLKIFVLNEKQVYIGMLPDDIGNRLIKFIKGGNMYQSYVKSLHDRHLAIFIKEVKRVSRFKNTPSFPVADKQKIKQRNQESRGSDESSSRSED